MARLLLDENLPQLFGAFLAGHEVETVRSMGWTGVKNGTLLKRAAEEFDVLLTMDKSMQYQQSLKGLHLAVIIIRARSNSPEDLKPMVLPVLQAIDGHQAGVFTIVELPQQPGGGFPLA